MTGIVACVLKSGGDFLPFDVEMLASSIEKHLPGWKFVCLSDVPSVADENLIENWPGWWSKLELFRPGLFKERVLYFDLDTLIIDNLKDVASCNEGFFTLGDFYRKTGIGSGVMSWTPDDMSFLFNMFRENPDYLMSKFYRGGDQAFIESIVKSAMKFQDVVPNRIVSFKPKGSSDRRLEYPIGSSVVCFHGVPRPWQAVDIAWIGEIYNEFERRNGKVRHTTP